MLANARNDAGQLSQNLQKKQEEIEALQAEYATTKQLQQTQQKELNKVKKQLKEKEKDYAKLKTDISIAKKTEQAQIPSSKTTNGETAESKLQAQINTY